MFDVRRKIKIFVANGEVRYGPKVEEGFFPIFSVDTEVVARLLVRAWPWAPTDSLSSYAKRLEEAHRVDFMGISKFVSKPVVDATSKVQQRNAIVDAIMDSAKDGIADARIVEARLHLELLGEYD